MRIDAGSIVRAAPAMRSRKRSAPPYEYASALNPKAVATAMATCSAPNSTSVGSFRRSQGAAIRLPPAMPASTVPSMAVKAYVVAGKYRTSVLNQTTSRASDVKPEKKKAIGTISALRLRDSPGGGSTAGAGRGAVAVRRASRIAATPTLALTAAAICSVRVIPTWPISTKPARRAPAIAPQVLMPYSRLMRSPMAGVRTSDDRSTSGSVAPISIVGGSSTSAEQTIRATARAGAVRPAARLT